MLQWRIHSVKLFADIFGSQDYGFRPGPTQIELYKHRRWLETGNFGFRK